MNADAAANALLPMIGAGFILALFGYAAFVFHMRERPGSKPRYLVESQNGDTGTWEPMASTDDLDTARGAATGKHRRLVDQSTGQIIE